MSGFYVALGVLIVLIIAVPVIIWLLWRWDKEKEKVEMAVLEALKRRPWQNPLSVVIYLHIHKDLLDPSLVPNGAAMRFVLDDLCQDGRVIRTVHDVPLYALRGAK